mgnify:CR=1 FL=1
MTFTGALAVRDKVRYTDAEDLLIDGKRKGNMRSLRTIQKMWIRGAASNRQAMQAYFLIDLIERSATEYQKDRTT